MITDFFSFFSKSFLITLLFLMLSIACFAQTPPEIKAIQDKMERGEKLTPEEKTKFNDFLKEQSEKLKQQMDKLKDLGKPKPFDPTKPVRLPLDDDLPKLNPAAHYNNATPPNESEYLAIVKKYNAESGTTVAENKSKLNDVFAKSKNAADISNYGAVALMRAGKDQDNSAIAIYSITTAALKDAKDANIANNFGVLLKNEGNYEDSLKVLLYAEKQSFNWAILQTNIGWTIAYLGDFPTAKMRFQQAINFDKYQNSAYEGLGLLYRVEGNLPEASKYLRMCLRQGFSPSAAKSLSLIEGKADVAIVTNPESANADETPGMRLSDILEFPFSDKTRGEVEFSDSPEFFSASVKRVSQGNAKSEFVKFHDRKREELKAMLDEFQASQTALDPIRPETIRNENLIIYPRSYELEAFALIDMEKIFGRRHLLRYAKFIKRFQKEIKEPLAQKYALDDKTFHDLYKACGTNEECQQAEIRKFCRIKVTSILTYNPTFRGLWEKYVQEERADLRRYVEFSAPWLSEIKNEKLNNYFNLRRHLFVKIADPLEQMGVWGDWEGLVISRWSDDCEPPQPENLDSTPIGIHGNKLKVFPNPYATCHVPTWKNGFGIGSFSISSEATCDMIKLEFVAADVYFGFDTKFADNPRDDVTTFHFGASFKAGVETSAGGISGGVKAGGYVAIRNDEIIDHGLEGALKSDWKVGNKEDGFAKGEVGKLGTVNISLGSGPRDSGKPAVDFQGVLPDAVREINKDW